MYIKHQECTGKFVKYDINSSVCKFQKSWSYKSAACSINMNVFLFIKLHKILESKI